MIVTSGVRGGVAHADDRVGELAKVLAASGNDKARIAAVAALARLGDRRALKPLVNALHDPNAQVRAVAATALGKLGHKAALPALKGVAVDDTDTIVRTRAREAAVLVATANRLPAPFPADVKTATVAPKQTTTRPRAGFGNQPRVLKAPADLYVLINSSADDSPGRADKAARKAHAEIVKAALASELRAAPMVTMAKSDAERLGLDPRNIDLSVTKLEVAQRGAVIEVDAQLRLAISDENGKMLSFLSGGAKVQVPKRTFNAKYLPQMRREALENAMRGMCRKLLAHLRDPSRS